MLIMPGLGRYPCESCRYIASSRRMLARHFALVHSKKVFKCPLCPFITRYAANWYRHKRDLHGLTKFTSCEVCGFFANSTEELAEHKETEHPESLQLQKYQDKYHKEKERLSLKSENSGAPDVEGPFLVQVKEEPPDVEDQYEEPQSLEEQQNDQTSNAEAVVRNYLYEENAVVNGDSVRFSLPLNANLLESSPELQQKKLQSPNKVKMNYLDPSNNVVQMSPLKVRRSYNCESCGLLTTNPREFLYHQRDVHKEKMNIHECKFCIYASKHIQKLQRHCDLVHRGQVTRQLDGQKISKNVKPKADKGPPAAPVASAPLLEPLSVYNYPGTEYPSNVQSAKPTKKKSSDILHCSSCSYQTRNKMLLSHHEKTMHMKKKFYRCPQCGYITNEKARFTKHIKYHNLPKMKCEFCHFRTAYKWNMDRHMKNHEMGAAGEYNCLLCSFITKSKQSLKLHVTKHHEQALVEGNDEGDEDEEIEVVECDEAEFNANQLGWNENLQDQSFESPESEALMDAEAVGYSGDQNSDTIWKQGKLFKKELKCQSCDFTTSWPFELKKHEEVHKSSKKHSCPLCGMRFEHVAWLSKHLCRVHKDNSQALDMAAALEVLKPNRRAPQPSQEQVTASFQSIIQQTEITNSPEPSLLSTLLNQSSVSPISKSPDYLPYAVSKNPSPVNPEPQETYPGYSGMPVAKKPQLHSSSRPKIKFPAGKRSCNLCNYKTRWSSELEKHMRTHSDHKPFPCSRCDFRSKWKGDLNRHMMKYHGIKSKNHMVPKLKLKKALSSKHNSGGSWQAVSQESSNVASSAGGKSGGKDQESPLDLTVGRGTFLGSSEALNIPSDEELDLMDMTLENIEPVVTGNSYSLQEEMSHLPGNDSSLALNSDALSTENFNVSADELPTGYKMKKKYQCPFCTFNTGTPSRFHVHIVQHYNKRPFMCSECGLRSNWEWDITKHIRLKACKEKTHQNACVLLTDETGRRNYEKYDKYLTDVPVVKKTGLLSRISPDGPNLEPINNPGSGAQFSVAKSYAQKKLALEGGHLNTNVEDAPVNIVVTPDIDMSFSQEAQESVDGFSQSSLEPLNKDEGNSIEKRNSIRSFYCKHCNYKNTSRKVVISHLTVHAGTRPFSCRVCGMSSNWRQVVVKHVKTSHNGYMSDVEERLKFVQEGHGIRLTSVTTNGTSKRIPPPAPKDKAQFGCKLCPYKCDKEFYIKFHMKQHKPREGANYKCAFCPYYVKFKKTLVRHMKLHSDPPASTEEESESYTGSLPSRPFFTPESDNHRTQNYVKDNGTSFSSANHSPITSGNDVLEVNSDTDDSIPVAYEKLKATAASIYDPGTKTKRHVCKHCPYRTDNKTQFLYHKQFHRPNATAPYRCSLCSYWATMQHLITQHMKIHRAVGETPKVTTAFQLASSVAKPVEEEEAGSPDGNIRTVYVQRGDFVEKMFKCNFCPMMNKKRANVKVHQKNHLQSTEDGKFGCNMCNYKCLSQGGLTNHMKMHVTMENTCEIQLPSNDGLDGNETHDDSKDPDMSLSGVSYACEGGIDIISKKKVFSYLCMRCPAVFKSSQDLQVHKSFHGSGLAFGCPHCDYRAKHKPHLFKHLQVHSPDYLIKRGITRPPPIDSEKENSSEFDGFSDVDPLLVEEASEVRNFLRKSRRATKKMHRCDMCPAAFSEITTLSYHISLHGSNGQFGCSECNYSTVRSANLSLHAQLHSRILPSGQRVRVFRCPKCPASFQKRSRYDNHLNLHGRNYKYSCDHCDYSVRFAANLTKHKLMHSLQANKNKLTEDSPTVSASGLNSSVETYEQRSIHSPSKSLREISRNAELFDEKKAYVCDRCPYYQPRKDAVLSHMRRHSANDRCKCPYCDYSTSQSYFLRDHIKMHLQPSPLYAPEAYMRCKSFQIYLVDGDKRTLVFEDKGPKYKIKERFFPPATEDLEVGDDDTDVSEVSYTGVEATDDEALIRGRREDCRPISTAKTQSNGNRSHYLNNNSEGVSDVDHKAILAKCKQPKVALVDFVTQREMLRKVMSSDDFLLISKALKKNKKLKQRLLKNSKKQLKISSYKAFASGFVVKSKLKTKSKEDKLWRKKEKKSVDSKKSSIVVKIKVDNAEKPSEVKTQDTPMSEDENCSDAASDVTIPVDDFIEDCSMEDDSSFSNPGPPPSSVSENSKNEDISISSVLSNGSSIKLNKCSVAVEMLKLDRAVQGVKKKQSNSDNVAQGGFCSFDMKDTARSLLADETSTNVFAEVGINRQSNIAPQKLRDPCAAPSDDDGKLSANVSILNNPDRSVGLMKADCSNVKVNQCLVSVKPLEVNQSVRHGSEVSVNTPLSSDDLCPPDVEFDATKMARSKVPKQEFMEVGDKQCNSLLSQAKHFRTSSIYAHTTPTFSNSSKNRKDVDKSIPFEAHHMMTQASAHFIAVEPPEPDGCCLKIESVQTITSTSPFNGSQKWSEEPDAVSHLVMNHLHSNLKTEASNQNDIFAGHPTQISSASALNMNYRLGQSGGTLIDPRRPICVGEYAAPIVSSQQCHPALKIVEVVGGSAFSLKDVPGKLGCPADGIVSELNACKDLQLAESSSQIGVLPEHWTTVTSSRDFSSVMATDPVLNGCLSNLQVENEVPLEILL